MICIEWKAEYATGIKVIDAQHKRIIDYINLLNDAHAKNDRKLLREVFIHLVDYTLSHFEFEESLMEDAGYIAVEIHKKTHEAFRSKIESCKQRFDAGNEVCKELMNLLNVWLIEHIAHDDAGYVPYVIKNIPRINSTDQTRLFSGKVQQYFN